MPQAATGRSSAMHSKLLWGLAWICTLAATYGAARIAAPVPAHTELAGVHRLRAALEERDQLRRAHLLSSFLQQSDLEALQDSLDLLQAHSADVSPEEMRLFMLAWSRFDAPGAYAWAHDWPTGWRHLLMRAAIYAWGYRDGPAAMAALEGVGDPDRRIQLEAELFAGWLRGDTRASAGPYIGLLSEPVRRRHLTAMLAAEILRDGPEALIEWAEQVPVDSPNEFKRLVFAQAAGLLVRQDPGRATAWIETHREAAYSAGSIGIVARRWVQHHDPKALFAWLLAFPVEEPRAGERSEAVAAAFRLWLREDERAARTWLESMLPEPVLDPAVGELALRLTDAEPESAVEWAGRIEDEDLRRRLQIRVARAWMRADREAALAWLDANDLGEDVQRKIMSRPRDPREPTPRMRALSRAAPAAPR